MHLRFAATLIGTMLLATTTASAQLSNRVELPSNRTLNLYGLERAWWNHAMLNPSRDRLAHLSIDENTVYAVATSGGVTAIDSESGKVRWTVQLGYRDDPSFPVVSNDKFAMVPVGTMLYALDKWTGNLVWRIKLPGVATASPAVDTENIYIGTVDGSLYALDLQKIHELYEQSLLPQWSRNAVRWRYNTTREIPAPPIPAGNTVLVASRGGSLFSIATSNRDLRFQFETEQPVSAPLAEALGFVYLASADFSFYSINVLNGRIRWEFITGLPIRKKPQVIGDHVFIAPERGGMYCLSTADGEQVWWSPQVTDFLAATRGQVYATDDDDHLVVLSRLDSSVLGAIPIRGFDIRFGNDLTDRMYIASSNGTIVAIQEMGQEFPLFHKNPDHRPILPEFGPPEPAGDVTAQR